MLEQLELSIGDNKEFEIVSKKETNNERIKTSTRLRFEAEVEVISRQIGGLEGARQTLGLSQRKMCQLLLVDPSAWTRWQKTGAPPHIYRALQWYLSLNEKIPGLTPEYFIGSDPAKTQIQFEKTSARLNFAEQRLQESVENYSSEISALKAQINSLQKSLEESIQIRLQSENAQKERQKENLRRKYKWAGFFAVSLFIIACMLTIIWRIYGRHL